MGFFALMFLDIMELWEDTMTTIALMIAAILTAIVIAISIGV